MRLVPFVLGCVAIWCVSAMERAPIPEELAFWNSDKLLHFCAYAFLGALALFATLRSRWTRPYVIAVAMTSGYGVVDEVHQSFVPGRSSSALDWIADTCGALTVAAIARRRRQR